jgi:hypothetical protein
MTAIEYLQTALNKKLQLNYSEKYKSMLRFSYRCLAKENTTPEITAKDIKKLLDKYSSGVSYNTIKRHLTALINEAKSIGMLSDPMKDVKAKKNNRQIA